MRSPVDYESSVPLWGPETSARRIRELTVVNKQLADRVELWQWIAALATTIAMIAVCFLLLVLHL